MKGICVRCGKILTDMNSIAVRLNDNKIYFLTNVHSKVVYFVSQIFPGKIVFYYFEV